MIKPIFIGGSGRSGTNVLREVLATSSKVTSPSFETRYMVDPDGILPFLRNFSIPVSPYEADSLIRRHLYFLARLARRSTVACGLNHLLKQLPGNKEEKLITGFPYAAWDLESHAPGYTERLYSYVKWFDRNAYRAFRPGLSLFTVRPRLFFASIADRSALVNQAAEFVNGNIQAACEDQRTNCYLDDNTFNLIYATTLHEILPTARFIHVRRHPLDVVASYCKQRWCPDDPNLAMTIVARVLDSIEKELEALPHESVLELTLEGLLDNPTRELSTVCEFMEVDGRIDTSPLLQDRANVGRASREFSSSTLKELEIKMQGTIERFQRYRNYSR